MGTAILDLKGITVRFGGLIAADDVNISVMPGQISSVIGPNGAGKTTIFNCVTGVYSPTSGQILVGGTDILEPLTSKIIAANFIFSILFGIALSTAINVQTLWSAAIVDLYVYGQSFPWRSIPRALFNSISLLPFSRSILPTLFGTAISFLAAMTMWFRSRHSPNNAVKRGIARTFQNIRLFGEMSVIDNVLVGMHRRFRSNSFQIVFRTKKFRQVEQESHAVASELLDFVELGSQFHIAACNLPYGNQRRLEIARALATDPSVILLDEPAAGMNPSEMGDLMTLISKIRDRGVTVLLIEHHMKLVMGISDHVTVLEYGQKIADGTPASVQRNPRVIAAYLGDPSDDH